MRAKQVVVFIVTLIAGAMHARATGDISVHSGEDASATVLANKGFDLSKKGEDQKALVYYNTALHRDPKDWATYFNRANIYMRQRKWNLTIQDLNSCLRLKPDFVLAAIMRGWVNEQLGNYKSSLADYNRVLNLRPLEKTVAITLASRAWLEATCPNASLRNGKQAVADARIACNITNWSNADYLDTLAAAEAGVGDFDAAVRFEEQAIARNRNDKDAAANYARHLALYRQHHSVWNRAR